MLVEHHWLPAVGSRTFWSSWSRHLQLAPGYNSHSVGRMQTASSCCCCTTDIPSHHPAPNHERLLIIVNNTYWYPVFFVLSTTVYNTKRYGAALPVALALRCHSCSAATASYVRTPADARVHTYFLHLILLLCLLLKARTYSTYSKATF